MSKHKRAWSEGFTGAGRPVPSNGNDRHPWTDPRERADRLSYVELSERLIRADLQLCEMQAHMDELIEANLRLRAEVSEMTLKWLVDKSDGV